MVVTVVSADLTCTNGQVYVKITKKLLSGANEESLVIRSGSTDVFTSPVFSNNQEKVLERCLPSSTNNQYELIMKDTTGLWDSGAWVAIEGVNGNVVLKAIMTTKLSESLPLSLYSPINLDSTWKFTNNASGDWSSLNFGDSGWTDALLGSDSSTPSTGTQYLRKSFAGITGMAAIDIGLRYTNGIIAYINGAEVFRDNMPEGVATSATLATGSYSTLETHGVVRSAGIAESSQNVLAVEVHFTRANFVETIEFDGFISFLAPLATNNKCFVVPAAITTTSSIFYQPATVSDWAYMSFSSSSSENWPAELTAELSGRTKYEVNSFRVWPNAGPLYAPRTFSVEGALTKNGVYSPIMTPSGVDYETNVWQQFNSIAAGQPYSAYRFTMINSASSRMQLYEIQFLVCNNPVASSFAYPQSSYSFYARYSVVRISPSVYGLSQCSVQPTLPAGLSLDPNGCTISGSAEGPSAAITYTVTALGSSTQLTGTVSLAFTDCAGTMIHVLRTYGYVNSDEGFRIRNTVNDDILMDVPTGHNHPGGADWNGYLCVSVDQYDVTLYSTGTHWYSYSFIYLYGMLPEGKEEMLLKARFDSDQANDIVYYLRRHAIAPVEQWYYKMNEVPANWYSNDMNGWNQAVYGTFPNATNQIQLYKKTFTVNSLTEVSGLILSIRYQHGVIVYLNGHEAFRNHITGDLSTSSLANEAYSSLKYRVVTLPGKTLAVNGETSVQNLIEGSNVIAIALVASAATQVSSSFDATVRLMTSHPEAHIWEFSGTATGFKSGGYSAAFSMNSDYTLEVGECSANELVIALNDDRREWISAVEVQNNFNTLMQGPAQFKLYGRNSASEQWTLLGDISGLHYSTYAQKKLFYLYNNKPYNQFKFENFATGEALKCVLTILSLNLYTVNYFQTPATLSYPAQTMAFRDIEMAELIPVGSGFSDFQVTPALPAGLVLDRATGFVSGTATELSPVTSYQVTAKSYLNTPVTASFQLSVEVCTGGRSLMTVRVYADGFKNENSWKLFQGRGTSGSPLQSVNSFPVKSAVYYLDFCLNDGIYTFQGIDSYGDGWEPTSGYMLTADLGAMELEINQLPASSQQPTSVTTVFSTFFPFQMEYTDWKVYQGEAIPAGWNTAGFDDSAWATKKAAEIPNPTTVTAYIRKSFQLTNIDDYQVLNVRMKYTGGVAVYFNGNRVARFNLIENFDANTESIAVHDSTEDSKFHIVLVTAGVQEGTNVVAFEVHRPVGTSSSDPFVFDATGVFGVETCSTTLDSFSALTSTPLVSENPYVSKIGTINDIVDLDPYTAGTLPNDAGTFIEWTVENLDGSKVNAFTLMVSSEVKSVGFAIGGENDESSSFPPVQLAAKQALAIPSRTKTVAEMPVGLAGFRKFRWSVTDAADVKLTLTSVHMAYCKGTGTACAAIDGYAAVGGGQISPAVCPEGYDGYSYRICTEGRFGDVQMDKCVQRMPEGVRFPTGRYLFVIDTQVSTGAPRFHNIVEKWSLEEGQKLPAGLTLNVQTGEISGIPTEKASLTTFTVVAENQSGSVTTTVNLEVRKGQCPTDGLFPVTEVGVTAEYQCSTQGSFVGTQKRVCKLGEKDGEWEEITGVCVSVVTIVFVAIVVILVVVVVVFILIRVGRKTKASGGVKGKKKTMKKEEKGKDKKTKKSVKV